MNLNRDLPKPSDIPTITDKELDALIEPWMDNVAVGYVEIINLKYSSKPAIAAEKTDSELPELIEKDREFARRIIKKFDEWSYQKDVLVLWDIDETMGMVYANYANGGKYEWRFRPIFKDLVNFLREKYPQIKHGVLTTSPEARVQGRLAEFYSKEFLSTSDTYSLDNPKLSSHDRRLMQDFSSEQTGNDRFTLSDGETAKLLVLTGLKEKGVNVKNIDDGLSAVVWLQDGLCVNDLMPSV